MTRQPIRRHSDMPERFTKLERAVLSALAWELQPQVRDLAGQVEESLPGRRVNTGAGFHHEIIVHRSRPSPSGQAVTGLFGTVHAMVDGLEDAVGFQLQLKDGRILSLVADAYDQPTGHIDFQTARFDRLFYVDAGGASRAIPVLGKQQEPVWERHQGAVVETTAVPAYDHRQDMAVVRQMMGRPERASVPQAGAFEDAAPRMNTGALKAGVYAALVALGALLVLADVPFFLVLIGGVFAARWLTRPNSLNLIRDQIEAFQAPRG